MIAKLIHGKGFRGCLAYILGGSRKNPEHGPERAELISTNLDGRTAIDLASEFAQLRLLKPEYGKPVTHIVLSPHPDDKVSDKAFRKMARSYLRHMGYEDCPFVLVKHADVQPHCHLVVSKIKPDGAAVSTSHERRKSQVAVAEIEERFRLIRTNQKKESVRPQHKEDTDMTTVENILTQAQPAPAPEMSMKPVRSKAAHTPIINAAIEKRLQEGLPYPKSTIFVMLYQFYGQDFSRRPAFANVAFVRPSIRGKVINFDPPGTGKVIDFGNRITLERGDQPAPLQERVELMVALAVAKGWEVVEFSGSEEFLLLAWEAALNAGLEVSLKDGQQGLWLQFQAERAAKAQHAPEDLKAPAANDQEQQNDEPQAFRQRSRLKV